MLPKTFVLLALVQVARSSVINLNNCQVEGVLMCDDKPYPGAILKFVGKQLDVNRETLPSGRSDQNGKYSMIFFKDDYLHISHKCAVPGIKLQPGCWLEFDYTPTYPTFGCGPIDIPIFQLDRERKMVEKCG